MKISHVALWTRDLHAAALFWQTYFAAEVGEIYQSKRRKGFASRFVTLPGNGAAIELMSGPWVEDGQASEQVGWTHVAISLGSAEAVDTLAARCQAAGLLMSGARTTGDGFYEAVIRTPDGIAIELTA
ncbi:VOC family protein [Telmatospirillum sp.]|uniref:VOC family protein n=1 Tax=Telmatospirillum sp. TaxID=2079197 RepID=UPI00284B679F|nr:VOC family protein [Telmatospirillum sp.]MDR3435745.1 VOC family protein [Telmatospirillum sp.]